MELGLQGSYACYSIAIALRKLGEALLYSAESFVDWFRRLTACSLRNFGCVLVAESLG